jgi:hypothetical protein
MTAAEYKAHINGPDYRPENVRIVPCNDSFYGPRMTHKLVDFDGTTLRYFESYRDAVPHQKDRQRVIKAALTRRANKARKAS